MKNFKIQKGFTLIELIVVIAVLGILSAIVIVAVNPLEQLARGRDASRKSTISQLGRSLANYYTSQNSVWPSSATWQSAMKASGDTKVVATNPSYGTTWTCTVFPEGNYCFQTATLTGVQTSTEVVVYAKLESLSEIGSCGSTQYYVWYSFQGQSGKYCSGSVPAVVTTAPYTLALTQ